MLSSGGCGRTVSPCPHAHSTSVLFLFTSLGQRGLSIVFLPCATLEPRLRSLAFSLCRSHSHRKEGSRLGCHSHFSTEWYLVRFPSGFWDLCVKFPHVQIGSLFFFPITVCVSFPVDSSWRTSYCFPTFVGCVLFYILGAVVGCFGVILAMIGPRTTQELFSLSKL